MYTYVHTYMWIDQSTCLCSDARSTSSVAFQPPAGPCKRAAYINIHVYAYIYMYICVCVCIYDASIHRLFSVCDDGGDYVCTLRTLG